MSGWCLGIAIPGSLDIDDLEERTLIGHDGRAGSGVQFAIEHGFRFGPGQAVVARATGHDSATGRGLSLEIQARFAIGLDQIRVEFDRRGKGHVPVTGRMDKQQLAVGQPDHVADPADKITQPGKRIGAIVIKSGDANARLT